MPFWLKQLVFAHSTSVIEQLSRSPLRTMAAPATPAEAWTVVEEFAATRQLPEIDAASFLGL